MDYVSAIEPEILAVPSTSIAQPTPSPIIMDLAYTPKKWTRDAAFPKIVHRQTGSFSPILPRFIWLRIFGMLYERMKVGKWIQEWKRILCTRISNFRLQRGTMTLDLFFVLKFFGMMILQFKMDLYMNTDIIQSYNNPPDRVLYFVPLSWDFRSWYYKC